MEIVDGCRVLGNVMGYDNTEKKVERSLKEQKALLNKNWALMPRFHHKMFIIIHFIGSSYIDFPSSYNTYYWRPVKWMCKINQQSANN